MRNGWVETTLGQYIHITTGKLDVNAASEFGEYPFFTCSRETHRIDEAAFEGESVLVAGNGDLNVKYYDGKFNAYQRTYVLNSIDRSILDNQFLFLYMQTYIEYLRSETRGTVIQYLKKGQFTDAKIKLPPLPEQEKIVDLISSVDSYIEALHEYLESAKKSRNAVLHELLTAGGDDWEATTIGDVSDFISVRKSPEQLSSDSIYVGLEHLEPNNTSIDKFDSIRKVTNSLTPFDVGDVLFGRLRPYLHKVAIAEMFGFCSPEILVLRANTKVLPEMLLLYCDADSTITICVERSAGTRMPRTSTEDLASIEIKLPPMAEQIKLAELFSAFDADISHIGIALEKSKILRSGLLSDLLSGEHEIPASYDTVMGAA
jgi:type I restriction enzyme S subunit